MAKGRFQRRQDDTGKRLRINERIRISPIRLIDDENNQKGIVDTRTAFNMAQEQGLDLVEVAPEAKPPVCRIMDYGKWKYQQKKKEQKAKSSNKTTEIKEIRLRPSTEEHDLNIKIKRATGFIKEGHKVQFTLMFKGRQMAHKNIGFDLFKRIVGIFSDMAHVEMPPRPQGRKMSMLLAPGVKTKPAPPKPLVPKPPVVSAPTQTPAASAPTPEVTPPASTEPTPAKSD